jgi:phosphoenolpyruvate-protein kinase (PTS system EI component)
VSALFDKVDDPYLRERKGDVADVVGRLCMNLRAGGDPLDLFRDVDGPLVLVAEELSPSLIAQLDVERLAALRHRRRELDVSHGDPRALDAHSRRPGRAPRKRT